ncbi:MAG TPA: MFS transporter, partial [Deltaproteobacteria bacterium]|nr:MFS transporter [Deltaproteobacteria bacterium]
GLVLAGLANIYANIGLLYLAYGIIAGLGGGFGYVTPITTLIRWFPDKRGLMTGLAVMGYGLGSFIMGNAGPSLIMKIGVADTFFWWGAISFCLVLSAVTVLKNPPEKWAPSGPANTVHGMHTIQGSFTFPQAVKTPQLWTLWLMLLVIISAGLGLISQLSPMAQDVMTAEAGGALDEDRMKAIVIASGGVVAFAAVFNGMGRLFWAWISDTAGRKAIFAALFLTQAAGYIVLANTSQVILFTAVSCYLFACYGGALASMPAFVADEFGPEHIGKIYGTIFTACALAGIIGPYVFARSKELTGSFSTALYIESALLAAGFVLTITFKRPQIKT